jgi:hypothetical protein
MTYRNRDGRDWLWLAAAFLSPFGAAIVSWAGQQ